MHWVVRKIRFYSCNNKGQSDGYLKVKNLPTLSLQVVYNSFLAQLFRLRKNLLQWNADISTDKKPFFNSYDRISIYGFMVSVLQHQLKTSINFWCKWVLNQISYSTAKNLSVKSCKSFSFLLDFNTKLKIPYSRYPFLSVHLIQGSVF